MLTIFKVFKILTVFEILNIFKILNKNQDRRDLDYLEDLQDLFPHVQDLGDLIPARSAGFGSGT